MPLIIKKDGRREPYHREKLLGGIEKACQKRAVPATKMEEVVTQIERKLQAYGLKEIPSRTIGQMVMIKLHDLDKVAYVRFASVYRDFTDVNEFVHELQRPPETKEDPALLAFPFLAELEAQEAKKETST